MLLLPILILFGFVVGYFKRWWLVVPLSLTIPAAFALAGVFDDGESIVRVTAFFIVFPLFVSVGFGIGMIMNNKANKDNPLREQAQLEW